MSPDTNPAVELATSANEVIGKILEANLDGSMKFLRNRPPQVLNLEWDLPPVSAGFDLANPVGFEPNKWGPAFQSSIMDLRTAVFEKIGADNEIIHVEASSAKDSPTKLSVIVHYVSRQEAQTIFLRSLLDRQDIALAMAMQAQKGAQPVFPGKPRQA